MFLCSTIYRLKFILHCFSQIRNGVGAFRDVIALFAEFFIADFRKRGYTKRVQILQKRSVKLFSVLFLYNTLAFLLLPTEARAMNRVIWRAFCLKTLWFLKRTNKASSLGAEIELVKVLPFSPK